MKTLLVGTARILVRALAVMTLAVLATTTLVGPETVTRSLERGFSGVLKEALNTVSEARFRARSSWALEDRGRFGAALVKRSELLSILKHLRASRDRLAALLEHEREQLGTISDACDFDRATQDRRRGSRSSGASVSTSTLDMLRRCSSLERELARHGEGIERLSMLITELDHRLLQAGWALQEGECELGRSIDETRGVRAHAVAGNLIEGIAR